MSTALLGFHQCMKCDWSTRYNAPRPSLHLLDLAGESNAALHRQNLCLFSPKTDGDRPYLAQVSTGYAALPVLHAAQNS